jgi:hypothetical protein
MTMATILLSAAGAAIGAGFGGTVLGLSGAVIGRAVGATLGRVIDQRLLGAGSQAVDVGRIDRFRLMGASEGAMIPLVWGRARVAGQVIWATQFQETATTRGGKGAPRPKTRSYGYTVSLAIALCEGEITRVGRIWADGQEIEKAQLNLRVYRGTETQLADPKIAAVEGVGNAPAYRGTAYVVIEDLDLSRFGNRVPQFNFEVMRRANVTPQADLPASIPGVALIPGTGEYALATTRVHYADGPGQNRSANVNTATGQTDFQTALDQLNEELPGSQAVSLVVSWFGNDLRCGSCLVQPKVEQTALDGVGMPWRAGGIGRAQAAILAQQDGRPIYGGTPADAAVIEAIRAANDAGKEVMFYPFVLMEQIAGNTLPNPWTGGVGQPALPWRGRITTTLAPGQVGTADRTVAAAAEVAAFFGTAQPADFGVANGQITYAGPADWRYRRFILHYAKLCALAGGVEAFCIGSEMVAATQIRGAADSFPFVAALRALAADVRAILGPSVKISYAADWSEYFGYHTGGNVYFHLDPLWSDTNINFVGIDNYMPIADWRDEADHLDTGSGSIYDLDYLTGNIAGGEGFDWYYDSDAGRAAQIRLPITDGDFNEPWVYRYKDLQGWWGQYHHDRIAGIRAPTPTGWVPRSKPFRFTEFGCAAIDKGANQPNRFLDPKSTESGLPYFSDGRRDDFMQHQYYTAQAAYWRDARNNPTSLGYNAAMLDFSHSYAWAWDTRPYPAFPAQTGLWSDGSNYARGHWLNGRVTSQPLSAVVDEICLRAGVAKAQTHDLTRMVRGYSVSEVTTARAALQPLSLAFGFDALERDGQLGFRHRGTRAMRDLTAQDFAIEGDSYGGPEKIRAGEPDLAGHLQISFVDDRDDYQIRSADAIFPDDTARVVTQSETNLVMNAAEARDIAERWLAEQRVARDTAQFSFAPSLSALGAGDVFQFGGQQFRIDRVERREALRVDAVKVEPANYAIGNLPDVAQPVRPFTPPTPVFAVFLDLPTLQSGDSDTAPYAAIYAQPWQGDAGIWRSVDDETYDLDATLTVPAIIGVTMTPLAAYQPGLWDLGDALRVKVGAGQVLQSVTDTALFSGANTLAIGDGTPGNWEVLQFRDAVLVAPDTYDLRVRLRGQLGSDGRMPAVWPGGSQIVVLNDRLRQLGITGNERGLQQYLRAGALARGPDDASAVARNLTFEGNGLRPYAIAHLRVVRGVSGDDVVTWVRRTRRDGDNWQAIEVPLAEEVEAYAVTILQGVAVRRTVIVNAPSWTYTAAMRAADGVSGAFDITVAQLSQSFGAGPVRRIARPS